MPTIQPTKGRVLYYYDRTEGRFPGSDTFVAALVCNVNEDGTLNLLTVSEEGVPRGLCGVPLVQPGQEPPEKGGYAKWMDYQAGQAAKTEDVSGKLAERMAALEKTAHPPIDIPAVVREEVSGLLGRIADLEAAVAKLIDAQPKVAA